MKSSSKNTPRLVVIEGKDKGKVIHLKNGTMVLGRSKGDILIHDPRISRSHLALHYDHKTEKVSYTDLKSLNGTLVNGDTGAQGDLNDGDKIQIGDTVIDCQIGVAEETLVSYRVGPKKMENSALMEMNEKSRVSVAPTTEEQVSDSGELKPLDWDNDQAHAGKSGPRPQSLLLKIPKPIRVTGVIALLIFFYSMATNSIGPSLDSLEREISSIQNLEHEGKYDEALKRAEAVAKQFSQNSKSFLVLGDLYASQNKREQALAAYRKAHSLKPPQPLVHIRLTRHYLKAGLIREGLEELKHVDAILTGDGPADESTREFFTETANLHLDFKEELKQPPEKLLIIAKALQNTVAPDSAIGYKLEAESFFQQNNFPKTIEILEKALKIDPRDEGALNSLVKAKIFSKDMAGAQAVVETWMAVSPQATRPLIVAAFLKFNEKNYIAALPYLQKVVTLLKKTPNEPDYGQALHNMGLIYYEQNQINEAENVLRQACELGIPDSCVHPLLKEQPGDKSPASKN